MKLIQAMKQIKDLARKADDLKVKISQQCAHLSFETPTYGERQKEQVKEWLQAHEDILKEILRLRISIQKTNLATSVTIELDGKQVTKTIAEWIHRRRDLAKSAMDAWMRLTDKGLKEGIGVNSMNEKIDMKIVRNFDPAERDKKVELYRSEPSIIDATLEVANAVTDLITDEVANKELSV
jgi:hypothetical protein